MMVPLRLDPSFFNSFSYRGRWISASGDKSLIFGELIGGNGELSLSSFRLVTVKV